MFISFFIKPDNICISMLKDFYIIYVTIAFKLLRHLLITPGLHISFFFSKLEIIADFLLVLF